MMRPGRITALLLALILCLTAVSCADMGVGESETDFYKYFSKVYLLSPMGLQMYDIESFNKAISLEESDTIEDGVELGPYSYIAFQVDFDYTLTVDEFAFFFRGKPLHAGNDDPRMVMDFFISDTLPSKILTEDDSYVYLPKPSPDDAEVGDQTSNVIHTPTTDENGNVVERPDETDESGFGLEGYAQSIVSLEEKTWSSTLLEFEKPQTVYGGQYIIIRIRNNCIMNVTQSDIDALPLAERWKLSPEAVSFTFNYLMFRFTSVIKD